MTAGLAWRPRRRPPSRRRPGSSDPAPGSPIASCCAQKFQKVAVVEGLAQVPYIGWLLPKVRTSATEDAPLVASDDPVAECLECASEMPPRCLRDASNVPPRATDGAHACNRLPCVSGGLLP